MGKSKLDKLKSMSRKDVCEFVIENSDLFKVCDSCDAIVTHKTYVCPECSSYRFNAEEKIVKLQAKKYQKKSKIDFT
jgi:Zn finger protein HypA/HybF involved in hydrogenase expression